MQMHHQDRPLIVRVLALCMRTHNKSTCYTRPSVLKGLFKRRERHDLRFGLMCCVCVRLFVWQDLNGERNEGGEAEGATETKQRVRDGGRE